MSIIVAAMVGSVNDEDAIPATVISTHEAKKQYTTTATTASEYTPLLSRYVPERHLTRHSHQTNITV